MEEYSWDQSDNQQMRNREPDAIDIDNLILRLAINPTLFWIVQNLESRQNSQRIVTHADSENAPPLL